MRPASASEPKQHIEATPGVCGGKPRIAGTRVRVWDVAARALSGESPDEILTSFPHIELSDVHAALAYFYDNRDEIEKNHLDDEGVAGEARRKSGPGPLEEMLRLTPPAKDTPGK